MRGLPFTATKQDIVLFFQVLQSVEQTSNPAKNQPPIHPSIRRTFDTRGSFQFTHRSVSFIYPLEKPTGFFWDLIGPFMGFLGFL
jgi:hypothetical protein